MKLPEIFRRKRFRGQVAVEGQIPKGYMIASTEEENQPQPSIRSRLVKANLISESVLNLETARRMPTYRIAGVTYPEDFNDFADYLDAYYYVPFVARALDIKQAMIWQSGYILESEDEEMLRRADEFLAKIEADTVIRAGTLYAMIFGNMYWRVEREDGKIRLVPLNPLKMGVKLNKNTGELKRYVYQPRFGETIEYRLEEIIHLKFNVEPWGIFGVSSLRRCLPTIKALLYMEEKLPLIARRRADPLLEIQIGSVNNPVDEETFNRVKSNILNRKPGEDIFHDGVIAKIEEVYQSGGPGGQRQTIEGIIKHFRENLTAGLGVPEVFLAFGSTTLKGTAVEQMEALESEIRAYQRELKRLHENQLFKIVGIEDVKMNWRPLRPEDQNSLSRRLCEEIEHGIVSPKYARKRLGYPDEAGEGAVLRQNLLPF
ncbi:hypothetical protein DRO38_04395 [Candidatus Bathyarchaeota archaeon]|nr:MAG: hypothetical protein DRO38_04395 [Candidatus Bathyarchaeota archaeon]